MANFDVAVGITQKGLTTTLERFFKNPTAQSKIFKQNFSQDVGGIPVVISLVIQVVPTVVMAPPSAAKWQQSYNEKGQNPVGPPPANNVFQLLLSNVAVTGTIAGIPVSGNNGLEVYGQFSLLKNVLTVTGLSVWLDETTWGNDGITKAIVNAIIIPYALNTVNKLLNAIPFPKIPAEYTIASFQDPVLEITNNNELVLATSLTSNPQTNLTGYTPAPLDVYLQVTLTLINSIIAGKIDNIPLKASSTTGDNAANASAEIKATLNSIVAKINDDGTTAVSIEITDISGYGELGGTATTIAKTALCPIGTAIDAISDPKNWDKVISNFDIEYKPDPLDIPFSIEVTIDGDVKLSIAEVGSVQIIAAPKWSGVIGSTIAAMAAGFVDLLSLIFKEKIVNLLINNFAKNINVWSNPSVQKEIEGINITLSADTGAALRSQGNTLIVEGFTISFS